jgi:HEAT repeat protein
MADELAALFADLRSTSKEVRAEAARRLGEAGLDAVPGLLQTVRDPDWVIRYRAVEALASIGDPRVDGVLIASLSDERDHVRYMAAKGLGIRRSACALASLIRCLEDENEFVRMCVAQTLAALGDPQAIPALDNRLRNERVARVTEELIKAHATLEKNAIR